MAATAVALVPARSEACSLDPCFDSQAFRSFLPSHTVVAPDGVIVFEMSRGSSDRVSDADALAFVTVNVSDASGALEGTLELVSSGIAVWRPAVAFIPGSALAVGIEVDNVALDESLSCDIYHETEFRLEVDVEPLPTLRLPGHTFSSTYFFDPTRAHEDLVCCDGAYPADSEDSCGFGHTEWSDGYCTSRRGTGYARTEFVFTEALPERLAENMILRLVVDGAPLPPALARVQDRVGITLPRASEIAFEAVNLASGEVVRSEPAWSDGGPGHEGLGAIEHDVRGDLAEACEGTAYVCAVIDNGFGGLRWDPNDCEPFTAVTDDDGGDTSDDTSDDASDTQDEGSSSEVTLGEDVSLSRGCACRSTPARPSPPSVALVLVGLGALGRRRRSARAR